MLSRIIEILKCAALIFIIFYEVIFLITFIPMCFKQSYTEAALFRKLLLEDATPNQLSFYKESVFFKSFSESNSKDSIGYYYNKMDSLYKKTPHY